MERRRFLGNFRVERIWLMIRTLLSAAFAAVLVVAPLSGEASAEYSYQGLETYDVDYEIPVGSVVYPVVDVETSVEPYGDSQSFFSAGEETEILAYDEFGDWAETPDGWVPSGVLSEAPPVPIPISCDGPNGERLAGFLNSEISIVPERILNELADFGYEIVITDSDLGKDDMYHDGTDAEESTGVTVIAEDFCKSCLEADPFAIRYSAVHEVGHAFCAMLGFPCDSEEFAYCFEEESEYADTLHHMENAEEYFASSFRDYVEDGEWAFYARYATYAYMDELVREWS